MLVLPCLRVVLMSFADPLGRFMLVHLAKFSLLTDTSIRHTRRVVANHFLDISLTTLYNTDTSLKQKPKVAPMPSLTHFS